ncbi:DNA primase [Salmonella enterica]|nr:DNA primase [Salmonella enterica]ECF9748505.1 DNA primase [Salmonella enterica]EGP2939313.1 DNA primase [Salmonella enterica]EJO9863079.1 DNA primase [Salmonella enterica]
MLMLTTTAIDVDEELLNRCLVLTVNESREQTEAIHAAQRYAQTLEGLLASNEKSYITALHQNAQRLLRPLNVVNPFASQLTFMSDKTRTRRDHMKYLTLIQSVALLHQYQREVKRVAHRGQIVEYIEVTREDIALANRLAHEILGRTLDEMPPQTRKLLQLIQQWVRESGQPRHEWLFTRKQLRDAVQWGDTQLKIHLARLVEMEYLLVHRRGLTFCYELLFDGDGNADGAHLCGLIDVPEADYDAARSGTKAAQSGTGRAAVGGQSGKDNAASGQSRRGSETKAVGAEEKALFPAGVENTTRNHNRHPDRESATS